MENLFNEISELDTTIDDLKATKKNIENSIKAAEKRRQLLAEKAVNEMQENGVLNTDECGYRWGVRHNPPKPIIVDDSKIPDKFWKVKREVDKSKINAACKLGESVDGVMLDNGSISLTKGAKK